MHIDYVEYKKQLLLTLKNLQQEIVTLEEQGKNLDSQLEMQCEKLQQDILHARAKIKTLKAENEAKEKAISSNELELHYLNLNTRKSNFKSHSKTKVESSQEIGWKLAYNYSCRHPQTADLRKQNVNSWVEKVTKDCTDNIRKINQHILEGNLSEIEKITGTTSVDGVFNYVNGLLNDIEELAEFFNLAGKIRAVYAAFKMIIEDCKTTGFYTKKKTQSYKRYSKGTRDRHRHTAPRINRKDFPMFRNCQSMQEGKELRKKLSVDNHPDRGGCEEMMKQINHQFDLFVIWLENF